MKKELLFTRKHNGECYNFFLEVPSYPGEKGPLGIELMPTISVETPANSFGYPDTILLHEVAIYENNYFSHYEKKAYTLHRYIQPGILKRIEKQMLKAYKKYCEA